MLRVMEDPVSYPHRRSELTVLVHRRLRRAVAEGEPVDAEQAIGRRLAESAAVDGATALRMNEPVVAQLPDEATLDAWFVLEELIPLREVAVAVAHRVAELA